ncbi:MAG TPA: folate-binding protein [Methylothermaceae bacterium]|nr:folate-binding protein [Methylothermaceae bacterium]
MEKKAASSAHTNSDQILFMPVPGLAGIAVAGADAFTFLQGQATCDMRQITPGRSRLGAFCNPQGRVVATFRILAQDEGYLLLLAADLLEPVIRRLQMYVLRAKVSIQTADVGLAGIGGMAARLFPDLPEEANTVTRIGELNWVRIADPEPRWLVVGDFPCVEQLRQRLATTSGIATMDESYWSLREIRSGIPTIHRATSEKFLPQMLNLELLGGVSFNKGCYTGQEVIARSQFRGQVKRRLYHLGGPLPHTPAPGDPLVDQGNSVGQVIDAAPAGTFVEFLAVIRCDRAHSSTVRLKAAPETALRWLDLGYTLP